MKININTIILNSMKIQLNAIYILFIVFITSGAVSAKDISVVFRYDDFTLTDDSVNTGIVKLFQKHSIPLVLGVIPFDVSENDIFQDDYSLLPLLKYAVQNQSIEIALHGYNHTRVSTNGEFGNVPIKEQFRRIDLGKSFLDSVFQQEIITFIPPWNAYDENTLKVMEVLEMKIISSSLTINQPYSNERISYLPHTIDNPALLIPILEQNKNRSGVIVLMFHPYDIGKHFSLQDLDSLLSKVSRYDLNFTTFKGLIIEKESADGKRFGANLEVNLMSKLLNTHGVLYSTCRNFIVKILNLLIYLLIVAFLFSLPLILFSKFLRIERKKVISLGSILLIICGIAVWFHWLGPLKLMIISSLLALFGGSILSVIINHKHTRHMA